MNCPECKENTTFRKHVIMVLVQFQYDEKTGKCIQDGKDRLLCPNCGFQRDMYICRKCGRDQDECFGADVKLKTDMDGGYTCTGCIVKKIESKMCPNCFNTNIELETYLFINNKINIKCLNCGYIR